MKKGLNEKQVLKKLGVKKFSEVSADKALSFSSMLPNINPEVAKKALEQFPEFVKFASNIISEYKGIVLRGYDESSKTTKAYLDSCNKILESLQKELDKPLLSEKKRDKIINKMIEVAVMIDKKDNDTKKYVIKRDITIGTLFVMIIGGMLYFLSFGKIKISK